MSEHHELVDAMDSPGTAAAAGSNQRPDRVRTMRGGLLTLVRDYGIVVSFGTLFCLLALMSDPFTSSANLLNILEQQSPVLIMGATGTLVVIAGGIDLSVGATFALCGVAGARVAEAQGPIAGVLAGLVVGALVGLVNGLLTTYGRIQALIGTLATSFVVAGVAVIVSGGNIIVVRDQDWRSIGTGETLGIPTPIWLAAAVVASTWILLTKTIVGRHVFAAGGNDEAAWLSGVRTARLRVFLYTLSGFSAGLAGVIVASRVGSAQSGAGTALLFGVLAGIVIGGTSVMGGAGAVWKTCLGILFLALIHNGFTLLQADTTYEQVVSGILIVLAVGVDAWSRRGR